MSNTIYEQGSAPNPIVLTAGQSIAIYARDKCDVFQALGYPNVPNTVTKIGTVIQGQTVFGPYANGANISIDANASQVQYEVGLSPQVKEKGTNTLTGTPGVLNATGTLTAAMILAGIVTSSTAAAVAGTVDTGAIMDTSSSWGINDSWDWSVINTGGANAFTVTASTGHTLVGSGVVALTTSARFKTRKTAAGTFVTYRLS